MDTGIKLQYSIFCTGGNSDRKWVSFIKLIYFLVQLNHRTTSTDFPYILIS